MTVAQPPVNFPQSEKRKSQHKSLHRRDGDVFRHVFNALCRRIRQSKQESGKRQPVRDEIGARVGDRDGDHQKPKGGSKEAQQPRCGDKARDRDAANERNQRGVSDELSDHWSAIPRSATPKPSLKPFAE